MPKPTRLNERSIFPIYLRFLSASTAVGAILAFSQLAVAASDAQFSDAQFSDAQFSKSQVSKLKDRSPVPDSKTVDAETVDAEAEETQLLEIDRDPANLTLTPTLNLAQTPESEMEPETEETDTEEEIPEVEIYIDRILTQPVFAPFRLEGTLQDSSRPVYVVPREQLEILNAVTIDEALRFLPGVLSDGTSGGQVGSVSSQFIRGGDSTQTLILLNGRPLNDLGFGGDFDLATFTTDFVERLELVPGGSSTLYGSGGVGGTLNIVTQEPTEEPQFSVRGGFGSFGYNQQSVRSSGTVGDFGWVVGYNRTYSENDFPFELESIDFSGTRDNAEVNYNNVDVKLTADIGDRNRLTFTGLYLSRDLGIPGGVPTDAGSLGQFNSLTPDAQQYTENWLFDLLWESQLNSDGDSLLTARVYTDVLDYTFRNPNTTRDEIDRTAFGFQLQHSWQLADAHNLTYGADFRTVNSENNTFSFFTGESRENYDDNIDQGAIFARYELDITPDFTAHVGVRQDFNSLENGSFTSPSAGFLWRVTDSTRLRANYARSFNAPLISEIEGLASFNVEGNPDLRPERGNSFDIGLDQEIGDFGLFRLTFFLNRISELVAFEFGSPTSTFTNISEVETIGLEADLNIKLAQNFFAFANLTLNDTRIIEDQNERIEGNDLSFRDGDSFNLGVAYARPNRFYTGVFLHHISEVFVDNANTETLGSRTTVDLKAQIPFSENVQLNASLNNLFDEQYEVYPGFPGLSRNFQANLRVTF
ncbi:TonB-dependent receptor [Baaleninema sp.]|uniref:TonB-dependent receptor n=1 Tax=Baaleninema sp. TaxID=3101197 RepID=UPI003D090AC3